MRIYILGYISVVKQKVKEATTEEYVALAKSTKMSVIAGARRKLVNEVDEHNLILIYEYEDISSVIDAQEISLHRLDQMRHLLVEIDYGGNVTEPASGTLIYDEKVTTSPLCSSCL